MVTFCGTGATVTIYGGKSNGWFGVHRLHVVCVVTPFVSNILHFSIVFIISALYVSDFMADDEENNGPEHFVLESLVFISSVVIRAN